MARLFLMCGNIGSGKTTFARPFAKENGFRYISADDCYAFYNGDECNRENKYTVWELFYRMIHDAHKMGQDVVIDTNAPYPSDRDEFLNRFPEYEEHTLIWVDTSKELSWKGNCNRTRKVPREVFDMLCEAFVQPGRSEGVCRSGWDNIYRIVRTEDGFDFGNIIKKNGSLSDYPVEKWFTNTTTAQRLLNVRGGAYELHEEAV